MPITKLTLENNYPYLQERMRDLQLAVPEAFADGKINWDTLREVLGEELEDPREEFFGLSWPGKREARKLASIPSRGTLVPVPGEGINEDETENLFIEGDNLEVLKLLQKSYAGKINLVYIDPPYNTESDFIYNDHFTDPLEAYLKYTGAKAEGGELLTTNTRADGRYHSKWLSMMYPRLVLSRNILTDAGVIIIHIDEHEYVNLMILMKEIFGEENDLGTIIWDKRNPKGDSMGVASQHESIVIFSKNKQLLVNEFTIQRPKKNAKAILDKAKEVYSRVGTRSLPEELQNCVKNYKIPFESVENHIQEITMDQINKEFSKWLGNQNFSGGESAYSQIDENGEVYRGVSMAWPNKKKAPDDYFLPLIHPITKKPCAIPSRGWRNPPVTMKKLLEEGQIIFGPDETTQPQRKYLLRENLYENIASILPFGGSDDVLLNSLEIPFDNPKPVEVAKHLIQGFSSDNSTVMDFFAGSCTTAHAVLDLNVQENHNRKFIVVQLPEKTDNDKFSTIAEIGKERIKKAIKIYEEKKEMVELQIPLIETENNNENFGFKVFSYSKSNFDQWKVPNEKALDTASTLFDRALTPLISDWKANNLLSESLLLEGFPLTSKVELLEDFLQNELYIVSAQDFCSHSLFVCLDEQIHPNTVNLLKMKKEDIFVCLDSALSDELKTRLQDRFNVHVI